MRILANENFPGDAVEALRRQGHDVAWVRTDAPGSDDRQVLERGVSEDRLLVTFDKDFGYLAFRSRLAGPAGVVLFRIPQRSPSYVARVAIAVLESRTDWPGHFAVVEEDRVRMTRLPVRIEAPE